MLPSALFFNYLILSHSALKAAVNLIAILFRPYRRRWSTLSPLLQRPTRSLPRSSSFIRNRSVISFLDLHCSWLNPSGRNKSRSERIAKAEEVNMTGKHHSALYEWLSLNAGLGIGASDAISQYLSWSVPVVGLAVALSKCKCDITHNRRWAIRAQN